MFTIIITATVYDQKPSMYQYTTLEGAMKMATLGYKENVLVFDENNLLVAQIVEGQEVSL